MARPREKGDNVPDCLNCHAKLSAGETVCRRCGADQETLRQALSAATPSPRPADRIPRAFEDRRPLPNWVRFLPLLAVVAALSWLFWPKQFPSVVLPVSKHSQSAVDECEGRDACIVVLLAPWCPHCRNAVGVIQALREKTRSSSRLGIRVVLISDTEENLEAMAEKIGGVVFLDTERRLAKKLGRHGVPYWYLLSANGAVRGELPGLAGAETVLMRLGAKP